MPILHDADPHRRITRCYRCRQVGHVVSQCPKKKRNWKCTICSGTHKPAKCPVKARTTSQKRLPRYMAKWCSMRKFRSLSAFRYSIVLSIRLRTVPSVGARTWSTWKWSAPCTNSVSSATVGALGVSFCATHATLQVKSAGELTLIIMKRSGTRVLRMDPHFFFSYFTTGTYPSCDTYLPM